MTFRENFKGVQAESGEFSNIPENIYFVIVRKAKETQAKSGNNMVNVEFRITEGEYENSAIWDRVVFHEKMKGRNKHILKVLNQPYEGEPIIEPANWIGQELRVRVRVKWDDYRKGFASKITQYLYLNEEEQKAEEKPPTTKKDKNPFAKEDEPPLQKEVPAEEKGEGEDEIPF